MPWQKEPDDPDLLGTVQTIPVEHADAEGTYAPTSYVHPSAYSLSHRPRLYSQRTRTATHETHRTNRIGTTKITFKTLPEPVRVLTSDVDFSCFVKFSDLPFGPALGFTQKTVLFGSLTERRNDIDNSSFGVQGQGYPSFIIEPHPNFDVTLTEINDNKFYLKAAIIQHSDIGDRGLISSLYETLSENDKLVEVTAHILADCMGTLWMFKNATIHIDVALFAMANPEVLASASDESMTADSSLELDPKWPAWPAVVQCTCQDEDGTREYFGQMTVSTGLQCATRLRANLSEDILIDVTTLQVVGTSASHAQLKGVAQIVTFGVGL